MRPDRRWIVLLLWIIIFWVAWLLDLRYPSWSMVLPGWPFQESGRKKGVGRESESRGVSSRCLSTYSEPKEPEFGFLYELAGIKLSIDLATWMAGH